jgi:hypothetical protein
LLSLGGKEVKDVTPWSTGRSYNTMESNLSTMRHMPERIATLSDGLMAMRHDVEQSEFKSRYLKKKAEYGQMSMFDDFRIGYETNSATLIES